MDPEQLAYLSLASGTCFIILLGTVVSFVYRNKLIVKATIPAVNVPIGCIYILMIGFATQHAIQHSTPCVVYLWLPFILAVLLGNSYAIKCWRLYVLATVGRLKTMDLCSIDNNSILRPNSMQNSFLLEISLLTEEKEAYGNAGGCFFRLDRWVYRNRQVGNSNILWKAFVVAGLVELTIPLVLNFTLQNYMSFSGECRDRTPVELGLYTLMIILYISIFLGTFFKIRKSNDYYNLKRQLLGSAIAWVFLFLIFAVLTPMQSNQRVHVVISVVSIVGWLLPFASDTLWPLWRYFINARFRKNSDQKIMLEDMLSKKKNGWDVMANFMHENLSLADAKDNVLLLHGLFFIREYILGKDKVASNLKQTHGDEIDPTDMDIELCALVVITWVKYLHKKGDISWGPTDDEAPFLVDMPEVEPVKKALELALDKIVKIDDFDFLTVADQAEAGARLRDLYTCILSKVETDIMDRFRHSVHFEILSKQ